MIAQLAGRIVRANAEEVVIDVGGVGYQVFCHVRTVADLHGREEVTLHVHTAVSDDAIRLYGFPTGEELQLFRLLIGVDRIGPRAALSILGRAELSVLVRAITEEDAALLATVPGVGRKTAERVVLELRGKLDALTSQPVSAGGPDAATKQAVAQSVAALIGLGFREAEVRSAIAAVDHSSDDPNSIISAALRQLDRVSSPA